MSRIFICHATEDRDFLEQEVAGLLRALGFDVWYAEEDIETAQDWERAIRGGLELCKWVVVLMSSAAARSKWVKAEVSWAFDERPENVIPLLIGDCNLRDFHLQMPQQEYIDFRENRRLARERLVKMLVEHEYKPTSLANVVKGILECPSKEILLVLRIETRGDEQVGKIIAANLLANRFFGRKANETIVGTSLSTLFEEWLPRWMHPNDLSALLADQRRLFEAIKAGEEIYAKVPLKFNKNHPYAREFAGKGFLPISIAYSNPIKDGESKVEDFLIFYANIAEVVPENGRGAT